MKQSEVIEKVEKPKEKEIVPINYSIEDISKITSLFTLLIKIDERLKDETKNN